jgi:hypothetical protein
MGKERQRGASQILPKTPKELLRLEDKRSVQGVCYFIKSLNVFKKKEK